MSLYHIQNRKKQIYNGSDSWVILSDIERSIKEKIERIGTPLKDWDISINYGIKTGYNEAFIIDGATKNRLIAEDPKSAEIIRPILRGRDIKRYSYNFADLWLITTFPSLKIDIEKYPAIKKHLLTFGYDRLKQTGDRSSRKKTSNKWFETQDSIAYWEDFSKQKIVWNRITDSIKFSYAENHMFILDSTFFITNCPVKYFLSILNSRLIKFWIINNTAGLGNGVYGAKIYIEKLPIPKLKNENQKLFVELINTILSKKTNDEITFKEELLIDKMVYKLYNLTKEEVEFIEFQEN